MLFPIVPANQEPTESIPVVKTVGSGDRHKSGTPLESFRNFLQPENWRATVGVDVGQHVSAGFPPARFTSDDQSTRRFRNHAHTANRPRNVAGAVRAGVVDHEDFVGRAGLGKQRVQASGNVRRLVVGTDNHTDCHQVAPNIYLRLRG